MKKYFIVLSLLLLVPFLLCAQATDPLVSKCAMNCGPNATYLKDYRVQLGKGASTSDLRIKQVFPLSKNMKYRFTLCNADNSKAELILRIKDFDAKSGKTFPTVDFTCNKTGTYQLYFDFLGFQQGLGVGIVSLVK
jgi:hypothetical protein